MSPKREESAASLYGLTPEEALRALLAVDPDDEPEDDEPDDEPAAESRRKRSS